MHMFFSKIENEGFVNHRACLKIVRDDGYELSLAGDDSCGAMKNCGRISIAQFAPGNPNPPIVQDGVAPKEFSKMLVNFLEEK